MDRRESHADESQYMDLVVLLSTTTLHTPVCLPDSFHLSRNILS